MKFYIFLVLFISLKASAFTILNEWDVCSGRHCKSVSSGDDLHIKHGIKENVAEYTTSFDRKTLNSCESKDDCWLYLGSVGDTVVAKINGSTIGNFNHYIHFESIKIHIPALLIKDKNKIELTISDLNQTRFGLRSKNVGIGFYREVNHLTTLNWLMQTGSSLLSAFTLLVLCLGLTAIYGIYRQSKLLPLIGLSIVGLLYLISFSEMPRAYFDPVLMSGPIHFILRLGVELSIVCVGLKLYIPHKKINFLKFLPLLYLIPISILAIAGFYGIAEYSFYKNVMLYFAILVVGGGVTLTTLSYFYYEQNERSIVFPIFLTLLCSQLYDLSIFWELNYGNFTIKWYLPFLVMIFTWIYIRRRIKEVRLLKVEALIGEEFRKLAHDISAPIQSLRSLVEIKDALNSNLVIQTLNSLERTTESVLRKYNSPLIFDQSSIGNFESILRELSHLYSEKLTLEINLSLEFRWFHVDIISFRRILENLLTNAIKANAKSVVISGSFSKGKLSLTITDDGNGISVQLQPYIFKKGVTSNAATGNGLGLSFIKEKLHQLGYGIHLVKSVPGTTMFKIDLPLTELILIDDNDLVRDTWKTLGLEVGVTVKCFSKFSDLNENSITSKRTPIFIDYKLGEEDGLKIIKDLKSRGFLNLILSTGITKRLDSSVIQISKSFPLTIHCRLPTA